jgi:uncharacterized protein (DUF427 family)
MKAVLDGTVIAQAEASELISIEGNWYFPPSSLTGDHLSESPTPYTCPWKGECQYFTVTVGDTVVKDGAFSYPHPYPGAAERVGRDFAGYLAFWKSVEVVE